MQDSIEAFGIAVRIARKKRKLTQKQLAEKLHMSERTIIDAEKGEGNPKLETVIILAQELNISLDAILFPGSAATPISKNLVDFFAGKSEQEVQTYISICQQIEDFKNGK